MIYDKEKSFDRIYRESSKEANDLANAGVKELYFGCGELVLNTRERLLLGISFQTIPQMIKVYCLVFLALSSLSFLALYFRSALGIWSDLILTGTVAISGTFVLAYTSVTVWLQDHTWLTVSLAERKELTAKSVIEKWVSRGRDIDDLMPALKASLDRLKKYQGVIKGVVIAAGAFLTFFKIFFGDKQSLHETVLAPLASTFGNNPYVYVTVFLVAWAATFICVSAPLGWRESLEPFLVREIEKYKKRQPAGKQIVS
jgi:hypothetical protein